MVLQDGDIKFSFRKITCSLAGVLDVLGRKPWRGRIPTKSNGMTTEDNFDCLLQATVLGWNGKSGSKTSGWSRFCIRNSSNYSWYKWEHCPAGEVSGLSVYLSYIKAKKSGHSEPQVTFEFDNWDQSIWSRITRLSVLSIVFLCGNISCNNGYFVQPDLQPPRGGHHCHCPWSCQQPRQYVFLRGFPFFEACPLFTPTSFIIPSIQDKY